MHQNLHSVCFERAKTAEQTETEGLTVQFEVPPSPDESCAWPTIPQHSRSVNRPSPAPITLVISKDQSDIMASHSTTESWANIDTGLDTRHREGSKLKHHHSRSNKPGPLSLVSHPEQDFDSNNTGPCSKIQV